MQPTTAAVLEAAKNIVTAFANTDTEAYFAKFDSQATFIFHTENKRLNTRAEYEQLWANWLDGGWRVVACESSDQKAQVFNGGAVFTHTVDTTVQTEHGQESYRERETIVFAVSENDSLIAVHEHLSPLTAAAQD